MDRSLPISIKTKSICHSRRHVHTAAPTIRSRPLLSFSVAPPRIGAWPTVGSHWCWFFLYRSELQQLHWRFEKGGSELRVSVGKSRKKHCLSNKYLFTFSSSLCIIGEC